MKKILLSFLISFLIPTLSMADDSFTSGHNLCRTSIESAQKSSYLRTIGSVKKCRRPQIANPITPWRCNELDPDDYEGDEICEKKHFRCEREYDCRYLSIEVNKKFIEEEIKKGRTGTFFPRKLSRETASE